MSQTFFSGSRLYPAALVTQLAEISLEFLQQCEQAQFIRAQITETGSRYTADDIRQVARVRRLREDLGLDWEAVEVVLHMRHQAETMLAEIEAMEQHMLRREQELLAEIQELRRRLAVDASWYSS